MAKTRSAAAPRPQGLDVLDARDGPTHEYNQHFSTISRSKSAGRRHYSRLERLLRTDDIRPEEFEAGRRFKSDYDFGVVGRGKSCLDVGSKGNGDGHPTEERIDACRRYENAAKFLDAVDGPKSKFSKTSKILTLFCAYDIPYGTIGRTAGVSDEVVKTWIQRYLTELTKFYLAIDKRDGRSTTSYDKEHSLKRLDPEPE